MKPRLILVSLVLGFLFVACSSSNEDGNNQNSTPLPSPPALNQYNIESSQCQIDTDCKMVTTKCCPCGAEDYAGINVNVSFSLNLPPDGCGECPQMDCPALTVTCENQVCLVGEN